MENVLLQYGIAGVFILVLLLAVKEQTTKLHDSQNARFAESEAQQTRCLACKLTAETQYRELLSTSIRVIEQNTEALAISDMLRKLQEAGHAPKAA